MAETNETKRYRIRRFGKREVLATVAAKDGFAACSTYAASVHDCETGDYWYELVKEAPRG